MGVRGKRSKNRGKMDVSMHEDKNYSAAEKKAIIDNAISEMYDQLVINSTNVCTYNSDLWADNLLADTLWRFLKRDIDAQWNVFMKGRLERYLTSAMSMALHSSTSPFYFKYRKPNGAYRELLDNVDGGYAYEYDVDSEFNLQMKYNIEIVSEEVNKLHFYNKQLIRDYFYEGMRLKDMGEKYNINPQRIARDIRKALIELKPLIENKIKL